jgi:hypothetical protein
MGRTRLWRVQSFPSQALAWSQNRHRGHVRGLDASWIVSPLLRKIQRAIDERMTVARHVGSEDANLAVRDLACGTSVLLRHPTRRLALLEKAGLVDQRGPRRHPPNAR